MHLFLTKSFKCNELSRVALNNNINNWTD
jgi:hypothetical protein